MANANTKSNFDWTCYGTQRLETLGVDDVLCVIGEFGRYQLYQYLLLCLVSVVAAFQAFNMVFIGATPEHRCNVPVDAGAYNMTEQQLLDETIPRSDVTGDAATFSQCSMYNLTELGLQTNCVESMGDVSNSSQQVSTTQCIYGWSYDEQFYESTIVSEVSA